MEYKDLKVKNIGDFKFQGNFQMPDGAKYDPIVTVHKEYEKIYNEMKNEIEEGLVRYVTSFGYEVDWERLERALEYDRSSYIKGYNDAFTASKEATDLYKLFSGMSGSMQEAVRKIMETTQIGGEING